MRSLGFGIAVVGLLLLSAASASAGELGTGSAPTRELPKSLLAVFSEQESQDMILDESEADAIRGEWTLQLRLPLVVTAIEGEGPFDVNLMTLSGGAIRGIPVQIRLRLGR